MIVTASCVENVIVIAHKRRLRKRGCYGIRLWCLTPLSPIVQLCGGGLFYWQRKTDLPQVTDKRLYLGDSGPLIMSNISSLVVVGSTRQNILLQQTSVHRPITVPLVNLRKSFFAHFVFNNNQLLNKTTTPTDLPYEVMIFVQRHVISISNIFLSMTSTKTCI